MVRPVTAQRTKSPGVITCTSPSRYLSLASPLKPSCVRNDSSRPSGPIFALRVCHHNLKPARNASLLSPFPHDLGESAFTVTLRAMCPACRRRAAWTSSPRSRACARRIGMRADMAIGELDVESARPASPRRRGAASRRRRRAPERSRARARCGSRALCSNFAWPSSWRASAPAGRRATAACERSRRISRSRPAARRAPRHAA